MTVSARAARDRRGRATERSSRARIGDLVREARAGTDRLPTIDELHRLKYMAEIEARVREADQVLDARRAREEYDLERCRELDRQDDAYVKKLDRLALQQRAFELRRDANEHDVDMAERWVKVARNALLLLSGYVALYFGWKTGSAQLEGLWPR